MKKKEVSCAVLVNVADLVVWYTLGVLKSGTNLKSKRRQLEALYSIISKSSIVRYAKMNTRVISKKTLSNTSYFLYRNPKETT